MCSCKNQLLTVMIYCWMVSKYQVRKSLLTNCHLEDKTEAGQKCWVKTKSLCYMYSAVNKKTVLQQCITKVMTDVINNMYLNYFYKVREGYSRTLSLYKWHVSLHFYLTYLSVLPNPSLPLVTVVWLIVLFSLRADNRSLLQGVQTCTYKPQCIVYFTDIFIKINLLDNSSIIYKVQSYTMSFNNQKKKL